VVRRTALGLLIAGLHPRYRGDIRLGEATLRQAAIVGLLTKLRAGMELSLLFITHDLALVRSIADRVAVLHEGSIMEIGATADVCGNPKTDYTRALFRNTPAFQQPSTPNRKELI
jgi:ABC-type dipeptide/oligopeptide/nickel transport system ATPase component